MFYRVFSTYFFCLWVYQCLYFMIYISIALMMLMSTLATLMLFPQDIPNIFLFLSITDLADLATRTYPFSLDRFSTYIFFYSDHVLTLVTEAYDWMKKVLYITYYFDQKVPGIYSENSKYKFYSSKVILSPCDISPSKYSPSTVTHLCQRLIQLSKHFWNSIVGIAIRVVSDFSIISFRLLKHVPRNGFFMPLINGCFL